MKKVLLSLVCCLVLTLQVEAPSRGLKRNGGFVNACARVPRKHVTRGNDDRPIEVACESKDQVDTYEDYIYSEIFDGDAARLDSFLDSHATAVLTWGHVRALRSRVARLETALAQEEIKYGDTSSVAGAYNQELLEQARKDSAVLGQRYRLQQFNDGKLIRLKKRNNRKKRKKIPFQY